MSCLPTELQQHIMSFVPQTLPLIIFTAKTDYTEDHRFTITPSGDQTVVITTNDESFPWPRDNVMEFLKQNLIGFDYVGWRIGFLFGQEYEEETFGRHDVETLFEAPLSLLYSVYASSGATSAHYAIQAWSFDETETITLGSYGRLVEITREGVPILVDRDVLTSAVLCCVPFGIDIYIRAGERLEATWKFFDFHDEVRPFLAQQLKFLK